MTGWHLGKFDVTIWGTPDGDPVPVRIVTHSGLVNGHFGITYDSVGQDCAAALVHIPSGLVVAGAAGAGRLVEFHAVLLDRFGELDWHRRELPALVTPGQYQGLQALRSQAGVCP